MQATAVMPECDLQLLRRLADSADDQAFAEIVRRYTGVVFAASLRILRDEARAQDVAQETFFRLLRQPRLVSQSLGGWLHRSATHLAIDVKRSERSRRLREKSYGQDHERLFDCRNNSAGAREPTWEQVSPYVDAALNEIADPTRSLLVRHFLQGVPQQDLAAELGCSPATVSRRIKSGVELLQQGLRRRGVYVALAALAGFCVDHAAKASPSPQLLSELGKMRMAGPIRLSPPPGANPPAAYPQGVLTPRVELLPTPAPAATSKLAEATLAALLACAGTLGVAGLLALLLHANILSPPAPNPAPPAAISHQHPEAMHLMRAGMLDPAPEPPNPRGA
jgi:RNA polymerase sigma-70 factor (ECF subfamily)